MSSISNPLRSRVAISSRLGAGNRHLGGQQAGARRGAAAAPFPGLGARRRFIRAIDIFPPAGEKIGTPIFSPPSRRRSGAALAASRPDRSARRPLRPRPARRRPPAPRAAAPTQPHPAPPSASSRSFASRSERVNSSDWRRIASAWATSASVSSPSAASRASTVRSARPRPRLVVRAPSLRPRRSPARPPLGALDDRLDPARGRACKWFRAGDSVVPALHRLLAYERIAEGGQSRARPEPVRPPAAAAGGSSPDRGR